VAAELAERLDSRLVLVNVRPSPADLPPGMAAEGGFVRRRAVEGGRRLLAEVGGELRLLECVWGRVEFGEPASRLVAVADEIRAGLIVVGARGRGAAGTALLGSVAHELAAKPSRPLLVVPPGAEGTSGASDSPSPSIVCGVDGSSSAVNAARVAGPLAMALGLRLVLVHVEHGGDESPTGDIDFDTWLDSDSRSRLRLLHRAAEEAGDTEVEVCLASGSPAEALEEVAARESAEMLTVGTCGHGPLKALALGSVSRKLSASSSRPVLIVNEHSSATPRVPW
jgi:nucleotide-binding universal stress UspA family protein